MSLACIIMTIISSSKNQDLNFNFDRHAKKNTYSSLRKLGNGYHSPTTFSSKHPCDQMHLTKTINSALERLGLESSFDYEHSKRNLYAAFIDVRTSDENIKTD